MAPGGLVGLPGRLGSPCGLSNWAVMSGSETRSTIGNVLLKV